MLCTYLPNWRMAAFQDHYKTYLSKHCFVSLSDFNSLCIASFDNNVNKSLFICAWKNRNWEVQYRLNQKNIMTKNNKLYTNQNNLTYTGSYMYSMCQNERYVYIWIEFCYHDSTTTRTRKSQTDIDRFRSFKVIFLDWSWMLVEAVKL